MRLIGEQLGSHRFILPLVMRPRRLLQVKTLYEAERGGSGPGMHSQYTHNSSQRARQLGATMVLLLSKDGSLSEDVM